MNGDFLHQAIATLNNHFEFSLKDLKKARDALWARYQTSREAGFRNDVERLAYVLSRLPGTYAACRDVLRQLPHDFTITSVLDLGCGPGTATLACLSSDLGKHYTLIEQDAPMLAIARTVVSPYTYGTTFIQGDLLTQAYPKADLVLLSYVLGEMNAVQQFNVIEKAYAATNQYLIIISPGMSSLFSDYLTWRTYFINQGASILAPCPSHAMCPMNGIERWCHFKARVQRTKELKYLKEATMGFEDEPYSYLIIGKDIPNSKKSHRIIDHPKHRKGHSLFEVCTGDSIETLTCSAKDPEYKAKKKLMWGDFLAP